MKKVFFLALICLVSFTVNAQENKEFKTKTIEFIKITGSADMFAQLIDQVSISVPEGKKADFKKEAEGTLSELYSDIADMYMGEFTEEEINELVIFYNSDLGKKLASKQSKLVQKGMMIGQSWGMKLQQMAAKYSN